MHRGRGRVPRITLRTSMYQSLGIAVAVLVIILALRWISTRSRAGGRKGEWVGTGPPCPNCGKALMPVHHAIAAREQRLAEMRRRGARGVALQHEHRMLWLTQLSARLEVGTGKIQVFWCESCHVSWKTQPPRSGMLQITDEELRDSE